MAVSRATSLRGTSMATCSGGGDCSSASLSLPIWLYWDAGRACATNEPPVRGANGPMEKRAGREADRLQEIVSLCKRRGFVFPSSEIYGGLNAVFDYGPLGV